MSRKRFTDADKWDDGWFCEQPSAIKLFWIYLCDQCDHAGVWEVNWRLAKFHLGEIDRSAIEQALAGRFEAIAGGRRWFVRGFIRFQYPGGLLASPVHKRIRASLVAHGIDPDGLSPTVGGTVPPTVPPTVGGTVRGVNARTPEEEDEDEDELYSSRSNAIGPTAAEHDGVCTPYPPAGDKRIYPKQQVAKIGLVEWIVHHPRCILGKDRDLWQGLFDYAGHETMSHAYERMHGTDKFWFSAFNDFIHANYEAPDAQAKG